MQGLVAATAARNLSRLRSTAALRSSWVCPSCSHGRVASTRYAQSFGQSSRRSFRSSAVRGIADKPYYITTPIFYVNASPHVGHLFTMVLADVLKRWEVLKGERPAYLCTGTDEHGMKVQQAADLQDVPPKTLCDSNAEIFKDLAKKANISNDYFIRTTDPDHREAVEYFWRRLYDNGFIYETKHEGWYCVSDETFYPENMVTKQVHPHTGKTFMASIETGNVVEWIEEKNYHFRMTALKDRLLEFYKENPKWVFPASRMREVVDWVENNLEDLSVSRPFTRLQWGIPVPDDPGQTIYVWVDALINYLTFAGYPNWTPGSEHAGGWPADVHVVGKDIVRFHCVYWPALLMALDLPLPKRVLSHGHWLMDQKKMSKSIGNVVNPFFAIDRWGVDTMRYFLIHSAAMEFDSNYNNAIIVERYKKGLQGGLGNLLNRVTRSKKWSVREAIQHVHQVGAQPFKGDVLENPQFETLVSEQKKHIESLAGLVSEHMDAVQPRTALHEIMELIFEGSRFVTSVAPWDLAGKGDVYKPQLHQAVYTAAETVRVAGILLQPFIPEKAAQLLDRLGVDPACRTFEYAKLNADSNYGTSLVPLAISTPKVLLVPYDAYHVPKYHAWMEDAAIREATASDRLTLEEEFENQDSWRTSADKLTFIVCKPLLTPQPDSPIVAGEADGEPRMVGDINLFLTPWEDDAEDDDEGEGDDGDTAKTAPVEVDRPAAAYCVGEVDIMIADAADRGRGTGKAAVSAFLWFIKRNADAILAEYAADTGQEGGGLRMKALVARIKATNEGSIALFKGLGFEQRGSVNYFGEIELVRREFEAKGGIKEVEGYEELPFDRSKLKK
ncbi:hypothetical protein JX265_003874 [Neoarthrinium moseri]|uniref:Probable methionine--tRNA ligase, mitochondrial n=1 Tax=Neoarthrinium moseri TaxID=1658444 RepID=A0A9P9WR96_9PEZI|nr:hypothetical protein JX266_001776 [Neoarthrinium moseri]KAI1876348.1 hypothetical protein JX265_003874 [Neoarthrinium moseri]